MKTHPLLPLILLIFFFAGQSNGKFVDYTNEFLPIRDQQDTSTCAAFAAASLLEWKFQLSEYLSPMFIYDKVHKTHPHPKKKYDGLTFDDVSHTLREYGTPREFYYPFKSKLNYSSDALADAENYKIESMISISNLDKATIDYLLENVGPFILITPVYNNQCDEFWKKSNSQKKKIHPSYHAVVITGMASKNTVDSGIYILRNSWSECWVDNGYITIHANDLTDRFSAWVIMDERKKIKTEYVSEIDRYKIIDIQFDGDIDAIKEYFKEIVCKVENSLMYLFLTLVILGSIIVSLCIILIITKMVNNSRRQRPHTVQHNDNL